jgi:hypothetical protein
MPNYNCKDESSLCDRFSMYYDEDYALALQLQEQFATEVGLLCNFHLISRTSWVDYIIFSNDMYASMLFNNNPKSRSLNVIAPFLPPTSRILFSERTLCNHRFCCRALFHYCIGSWVVSLRSSDISLFPVK